MSISRKRRIRTAILAGAFAGALAGAGPVSVHVANAQAVPRPDCPPIEQFVPGEDNYIVGNPDNIQVSGGVASWHEIRNLNGAPGAPGLRLTLQSRGFCRYDYEIWGSSSLGSAYFERSEFFRTVRPYD